MNYWHLSAAILSFVAFLAHLIPGSRETLSLRNASSPEQAWHQAFGVWQLISLDLLLLTGIFLASAFGFFSESWGALSIILYAWLVGWTLVWILTIGLSSRGWKYLLKLPQWALFLALLGLGYMGFA